MQKRTKRAIFSSRITVDLARGDRAVVGDEADDVAAQAAESGDHFAGPLRLEFEIVAVIAHLLDDDRHVEGGIEAGGRIEGLLEQGIDLPGLAVERIARFLVRGHHAVVVGQITQQPHRRAQGGDFVVDGEIDHPRLTVDLRPTQLFGGNVLAQDRFDHAGAGQTEEGLVGLDEKAALTREIAAAAGVEAEHAHDARYHPADFPQGGKSLGIAVKSADAGGNEGAGAVVHADEGNSFLPGHLKQIGQLSAVGGIDRAGAHGEVMPVQSHVPAVQY